ncbi:hybrid signal transduction histidine kinase M [Tanacetum coccineum]
MTGSNATNITLLSDKLSLVMHHHLPTRVPVKLDLENWNCGSWEFFFEQLCYSYEVTKYTHGSSNDLAPSTLTPFTSKELKVDKIVLSWIFTTLSDALQARLVVERPKSAKEAWDLIIDIVKDNKQSRTIALKAELRLIRLGDLSMDAYFRMIESTATILTSLDSPINNEYVVHYALEGISRRPSNAQVKSWRPCFNFAKGTCRFEDGCKFVHDVNAKPSANSNSETNGNNTDELLVKLLGRLGLSNNLDTSTSNTTASKLNIISHASPAVYHTSTGLCPNHYAPIGCNNPYF